MVKNLEVCENLLENTVANGETITYHVYGDFDPEVTVYQSGREDHSTEFLVQYLPSLCIHCLPFTINKKVPFLAALRLEAIIVDFDLEIYLNNKLVTSYENLNLNKIGNRK
jgi:hypothetical protein